MSPRTSQGLGTIVLTFAVASVLMIIPLPDWAAPFRPAWVTLVLIYWCLAIPKRVNIGVGWVSGLAVDVLTGTLMGQHAMSFAVVAFLAVKLHQQIRVYPLWQQAFSVLILVALEQLLAAWVLGIVGRAPETWLYWMPSITSAMLWPWVYIVLRDVRRKFSVS